MYGKFCQILTKYYFNKQLNFVKSIEKKQNIVYYIDNNNKLWGIAAKI